MKNIGKINLIVPAVIAFVLAGCVSPNIVLNPNIPSPATAPVGEERGFVELIVDGTEDTQQLSSYEEKTDRTQIGRSESLGVHLSDFWVEEPPPVTFKRILENNLKVWGFQATTDQQRLKLHGRVNKFSLDNRAINAFEFQADGIIDVDLDLTINGIQAYKKHYVETCTFKTASIPNKEKMDKVFNDCVVQIQKRLDEDDELRNALTSN
jgi:uncharacterized lipoprotein YajG